jgi:hypothetical protein
VDDPLDPSGRQYFTPAWKHARVVSTLKPGKDPSLPSSYRPITVLDSVGKLFENIPLTRVLREANEGWPALLKESTESSTRRG